MATPANWLMIVENPTGSTTKATYGTPTTEVTYHLGTRTLLTTPTYLTLDNLNWSVTPNGDSVEATWDAGSRTTQMNAGPRDLVYVCTLGYKTGENTAEYYSRFVGYITVNGNTNDASKTRKSFRALGLRNLLYSTDTGPNYPIAAGLDLASGVADTMIASLPDGLPGGIGYPTFASIGVTSTGQYNPGGADVGQNLDAIVQLCEAGGVAAVWGVNSTPQLFLEVKNTDTVTLVDTADELLTSWEPVDSDEVISRVRWVISDGDGHRKFEGGSHLDLRTPDQLTHVSDSGITTYNTVTKAFTPPERVEAVIPQTADLSWSVPNGSLVASYVGETADSPATLDRLFDGDPTSYCVLRTDITDPSAIILKIQVDAGASTATFAGKFAGFMLNIRQDEGSAAFPNDTFLIYQFRHRVSTTVGGRTVIEQTDRALQHDGLFVFGDRTESPSSLGPVGDGAELAFEVQIEKLTTDVDFAVESFIPYVIDAAALDATAEGEYVFPEPNRGQFRVFTQKPETGLLDVTENGVTHTGLPVKEVAYAISSSVGLATTYVVGPKEPNHELAVANRIRERDRQATNRAANAGRKPR